MDLHFRTVASIVLVLVICWKMASCFRCETNVLVETKSGVIRGSKMKSKKGKKILAFRGIPYGKPPTGELRFKRSEPFGSWVGTLDGTKESKKSYQPNVLLPKSPFIQGGEDCLYLNVYTKKIRNPNDGGKPQTEDHPLPVVVFLHGGAFVVGSCESMLYGPQVLLDRDIVLVGLNYRLGPFGWLSLETDAAPGNLGLHDQYLALEWVKKNIGAFGGDPDNVTLMGGSAGAMSAMCHLISPISQGLFHKIIALSGTPSNLLLHNDRAPKTYANALAKKLGYEGNMIPEQVLEFLQKQKGKDILKEAVMFLDWDYANPMPWIPVQDTFCTDPFLPLTFKDAVESGKYQQIPIILGSCKDEGLIFTAPFYKTSNRWNLLRKKWTEFAPLLFLNRERDLLTDADREITSEIRDFYFGSDVDISNVEGNDEALGKLTEMYTMAWFLHSFDQDSKLLAKCGAEVYTFILSHPPDFSLMDIFRLSLPSLAFMFSCRSFGFNPYHKVYGVCHGDYLNYIFPMSPPGFPSAVVTQTQKEVQEKLLDCVSSFAKSSKPTFSGTQEDIWSKVDAAAGKYLNLGAELKMERDEDLSKQLQFWNNIREKTRQWVLSKEPVKTLYDKIAIER